MKRFVIKTGGYLLLLATILLVWLVGVSAFVDRQAFGNHETDSNLLVLQEDQQYDLLFMGISHARNFSRYQNHQRVAQILDQKMLNLGQGNGACGVNEQLFYLDYFYHKENKAHTLVYFISPPLFFSESLALASNTFDAEPFQLDFFQRYWSYTSENHWERMVSYLQSKYSPRWCLLKPYSLNEMDVQLEKLDPTVVEAGQRLAYGDTLNMERFAKSVKGLQNTINLALDKDTKVVLIIPPALFGPWEGHQNVVNFAEQMAELASVEFYDFSETILDPSFYYDHHHLNTAGVVFFTEKYLQAVLQASQ